MEITPRYLTTDEAAIFCNIAKKTLESYRHVGIGPQYIKMGRLVRYRPKDLEAWIESALKKTAHQGLS